MQIPVEQFPILTPGQMNPFHQALQSALEGYQNNLNTAYLPYKLQADVASKQAYANNVGNQIIGTALSNPYVVANMMGSEAGRAQLNNLINRISQTQTPQMPLPGQGGGLWDKFTSFLSGNQGPHNEYQNIPRTNVISSTAPTYQSNISNIPSQNVGGENQGTGDNSGMVYDDKGNNVVGTQQDVQDAINRNIPSSEKSDNFNNDLIKAALAKTFPLSNEATEAKSKQEASTAKAKAEATAPIEVNKQVEINKQEMKNKAFQKASDEANQFSTDAYNYGLDLDNFHHAYNEATLKGPLLGLLAPFGPVSGQLNQAASSLQTRAASNAFGNKITNAKLSLAKNLKPNELLQPETEKAIYKRLKMVNNRDQEYNNFFDYATNKGITDENKIRTLWNNYQHDLPVYDAAKNKFYPNNLNKYESYIDKKLGVKKEEVGFDPTKILDYKYKDKKEFEEALNTFNDKNKQKVFAEMRKRGWH